MDAELCNLHLQDFFVGWILAEWTQWEAAVGFNLKGERMGYFFCFLSVWGLCLWLYSFIYGSCCITLSKDTAPGLTWNLFILLSLYGFLCLVCFFVPERLSLSSFFFFNPSFISWNKIFKFSIVEPLRQTMVLSRIIANKNANNSLYIRSM